MAVESLLLTSRDAAKSMAISERTLFDLTKNGDLPCVRIGRAVRYDPGDLKEWIAKRKLSAPPEIAAS